MNEPVLPVTGNDAQASADAARAEAPGPRSQEELDAAAYLDRGKAFLARGDADLAVADFTQAILLEANDYEPFLLRGQVWEKQGEYEQAIADYGWAIRLNPQDAEARNNRASAHFRKGNCDEAIADYTQAIQLAPRCARSYLARSVVRAEKGDYERALADFAKARALGPPNHFATSPDAVDQLRSAYDRAAAELDRFKRALRQAAADFAEEAQFGGPAAETIFEERRAADEALEHRLLAPFGERAARNGAIQSPPGSVSARQEEGPAPKPVPPQARSEEAIGPQQQSAARHYERGQIYQECGDFERAHAEYSAALAEDGAHAGAYLERGEACRLLGRFTDAVADFTAAIGLDGSNAEAYLRRGVAQTEKGEPDLALADYDEAIRLDPDLAAAYSKRGLAHLKEGKFDEAAEDAGRALELDEALAEAYFARGVARGRQSEYDEAIADLDEALRLEPNNALAHNQRALVHTAQERYDEAIEGHSEALRLEPGYDPALFNRGSAYRLQGDFDRAIADFTEFLSRRPDNAAAHYHRGLAHVAQEDYDPAIADFTRAFELSPSMHKAYVSCLEATRAKYARQPAEVAAPSSAPELLVLEMTPNEPAASAEKQGPREDVPRPLDGRTGVGAAVSATQGAEVAAPAQGPARADSDKARPALPAGKLRIECPECGTLGLFDMRNLGKMFRCPGCSNWWRTNVGGNLELASPPTAGSEAPGPARSNPRAPALARLTPAKASALPPTPSAPRPEPPAAHPPTPESSASRSAAKPAKVVEPPRRRRQREGPLRYTALWIGAASQTRGGRWTMAAGALAAVVVLSVAVFPSLFPSQLRSRGQKVARAWLAKDVEQIKQFAEPSQVESVPAWLKENPPPDVAGQQPPPSVKVAVQRNDGRTAEVVVQIKALNKDGAPTHFVFVQRWVSKNGTWYIKPATSPGRAPATEVGLTEVRLTGGP